MPLPPKEVIIGLIKRLFSGTNEIESENKNSQNKSMKVIYSIWGVFIVFFIEALSLLLWDNENYTNYWYYILNQIGYIALLLNILCYYDRLRLCNLKIYGLMFFIMYYISGILAIVFHSITFIENIQIFFGAVTTLFFILIFFNKK